MDGLSDLTRKVHVGQFTQSKIKGYRKMTVKEVHENVVTTKQTVTVSVRTSREQSWQQVEADVEDYLWVKTTHTIKTIAYHTGVLARVTIGHGGNSEEHIIVVLDSENPVHSPIFMLKNRRWKDFKVPQVSLV